MKANNNKRRQLLMSKYNDLSKIIDARNDNKITKIIPSPHHYYDPARDKFIRDETRGVINYSILGLNSINENKPTLIKLKSGVIALKIPYIQLFRLFKDSL